MITLFSIPKPFEGHIGIIQRNAIQSWLRLNAEVILCGDDAGVAETAAEFGVRHIGQIARNEYGTPLLSDAFAQAQQHAQHQLVCYINGDIILLADFRQAVAQITLPKFLMVGRRYDMDIMTPIEFGADGTHDWEAELRALTQRQGTLQRWDYIDYFVFPRHSLGALPDFAVGRPGWDNWFIFNARRQAVPVIDATPSVLAIHQNHNYAHVPKARGNAWDGPEGDRNRALAGGKAQAFYITDATHTLTANGIEPALDPYYLAVRATRQAVLEPTNNSLVRLKHRALGWVGRNRTRMPLALWRWIIRTFCR